MPVVVGIGEVLWDLLPVGKQLGGAPANLACHAHMLGADGFLVSAVGNDALGREICTRIDQLGLKSYITVTAQHPTGSVEVKLDCKGTPSYVIHEDVAWDHLTSSPTLDELAARVDAVCFGSLAQRGSISRRTIRKFLDSTSADCLRVFDINLRQSYYTKEVILTSLAKANTLKLNEEELAVLTGLLGFSGTSEKVLRELLVAFDLKYVALTRGERGSLIVTAEETVDYGGTHVDIKDTVGAGDAFTAAMVMGILRGLSPEDLNVLACQVGAFVCSQDGAVPALPSRLLKRLSVAYNCKYSIRINTSTV